MRISQSKVDTETFNEIYEFNHVPADDIVWRGQHIFVYRDIQTYDDGVEIVLYTPTHIGTGRKILPSIHHAEYLDKLLDICFQVDAMDLDWGALRVHARNKRINPYSEQSAHITEMRRQLQPYWKELDRLTWGL